MDAGVLDKENVDLWSGMELRSEQEMSPYTRGTKPNKPAMPDAHFDKKGNKTGTKTDHKDCMGPSRIHLTL